MTDRPPALRRRWGLLRGLGKLTWLEVKIAIYREGGILTRLRATTLRPETILAAHVLVKLLFTAITMALLVLADASTIRCRWMPRSCGLPRRCCSAR